jgi:hypothetical protein
VRRLLVRDPRKRPDAATILKHEWLRGGSPAAPEAPMQPEILNRMKRFANMNRFKKEALRVRRAGERGVVEGEGKGGGGGGAGCSCLTTAADTTGEVGALSLVGCLCCCWCTCHPR